MLNRTVIVICWICGFAALLMSIFNIPHTQVLVGVFWAWPQSISWKTAGNKANGKTKSKARKAASAAIAKIPFALAQHIARVYLP